MAVHSSHQDVALGVILAFPILATIVLALRLYSRYFVTKAMGWDDAFIVAAWVCFAPPTSVRSTR